MSMGSGGMTAAVGPPIDSRGSAMIVVTTNASRLEGCSKALAELESVLGPIRCKAVGVGADATNGTMVPRPLSQLVTELNAHGANLDQLLDRIKALTQSIEI